MELHTLNLTIQLGLVIMENPKDINNKKNSDKKSKMVFQLESQVEIGAWIQVIGQIIEANGLSKLTQIQEEQSTVGEKNIKWCLASDDWTYINSYFCFKANKGD
ncbi:hypothetical protein [Cytobacillus firmus]|uniref:hypothetical protein n=1 Tax=Cytobacillus firmus TaxID=1399 RepID=UPI0018CD132F|nr:hypothetical protein [Cytobacillus firmus]MBG9587481.1 hypothetical protein [Cytobacillus firmus]